MQAPAHHANGAFAPQRQRSFGSSEQRISFETAVVPGDILYIPGQGRLVQVGTAGGLMGHVMLILAVPKRVRPGDPTYEVLAAHIWPDGNNEPAAVWLVPTMESTTTKAGLYETHMVLAADRKSGKLVVIAELDSDRELGVLSGREAVEIWTSPAQLRAQVRDDRVAEVRDDMHADGAGEENWSLTTALSAIFRKANSFNNTVANPSLLLEEIQECWDSQPICTSVPIIFWQRFICLLAEEQSLSAVDLIMKWMPMKADRAMPADLLDTFRKCGWSMLDSVQKNPEHSKPGGAPKSLQHSESQRRGLEGSEGAARGKAAAGYSDPGGRGAVPWSEGPGRGSERRQVEAKGGRGDQRNGGLQRAPRFGDGDWSL
eukprot:gnl/TRDRNA2_/TRDRNA2_154582_c0_seq1.p1 gnl/TRDRNA2_/TRDRNA2_154582_c0~~gnl/TRDRNA2_/TRDRNA2_154582_c0_seq1.p1  ORF type:complete len:373 (+),score=49.22 gnl/TRDRNA2_/TRDRNA2_154582_c0_seq1:72-1190(+)